MELGRFGVWTSALDVQPAAAARGLAAEIESLGFGSVWFPEALRREAFANASLLLGATSRIVVATGIANIYARDAFTTAAGWRTLTEAYPERFLLGLGVSHIPSVEGIRGHTYGPPVATMSRYLDAMAAAPYQGAPPSTDLQMVLAALGPKMLQLAATRSLGAHSYFVPVAHTRAAREIMGPAAFLAVEQAVVLETDAARARAIARAHTSNYLRLQNYANNLRRLGFAEVDMGDGGSDEVVDALVAWGELDQITARLHAHLEAGADHVCIQVLGADPQQPPADQWRRLAACLL